VIYDTLFFFNELDLLEIRLETLSEVVDKFVLVEAPRTVGRYEEKPLYYLENKGRFAKWADKIIHVVVEDLPPGPDPWAREGMMRDCVKRGLAGAKDDDVVAVSDADEIISPRALSEYRPGMGVCAPEQLNSYMWVNCLGGDRWAGTRVLPWGSLKGIRPTDARRGGVPRRLFAQGYGGWHFSWLGGPDAMRKKLLAYAHQELNLPHYTDPVWLHVCAHSALDPFRRDVAYEFVPLDGRFPPFLLRNQERFAHLWRDASFSSRWINDLQLNRLIDTCRFRSLHVEGQVVELGCWEGRSTVAIANSAYPDVVVAVDTWQGSAEEDPNHPTVHHSREHDVYGRFLRNVRALTRGNVRPVRQDHGAWVDANRLPVKFCHIDGSHNYAAVARSVRGVLPHVPWGGVICGDDFQSAGLHRADLQGGVERAVRELLPGFEQLDNFWIWQNRS
jgi:beta-1,4-mannosyl-glycoprotein beta-1,4-N-acetylglucosaminyltransferase